jgi:hypothetical protein
MFAFFHPFSWNQRPKLTVSCLGHKSPVVGAETAVQLADHCHYRYQVRQTNGIERMNLLPYFETT